MWRWQVKNKFLFIAFSLIALLMAGCGGNGITISLGGNEPAANQVANQAGIQLQAVIDTPVSGATLAMNPIDIGYHATAQDGVAAVELSVDGTVLSNLVTPDSKQQLVALKYTWQPTVSGTHVMRVRAQSSKGSWSNYAEAMVNVQAPVQQQNQQQQQQQQQQPQQQQNPAPTNTPEGTQIVTVTKTTNKFYWGLNTCGPVKMTLEVQVSSPKEIFQVLVFNRMWSREGEGSGGWDSGYAMKPLGNGYYTFTYTETNARNPKGYDRAEFHYQFKVVGKGNVILLSSEVYKDILFDRCP
jgi:hypothetical protein